MSSKAIPRDPKWTISARPKQALWFFEKLNVKNYLLIVIEIIFTCSLQIWFNNSCWEKWQSEKDAVLKAL